MPNTRSTLHVCAITSLAGLLTAAPMPPAGSEEAQTRPGPQTELPKPRVIPEADRNLKNPLPPAPQAIATGRSLFSSQCSMCHGAKGDGKGDLAERLKLTIPDFTSPRTQAKRTDGELFYILTHGHGRMPGEGDRLEPEQKWEIIHYIRTLAPADKPKP